jgi:hypothetical protein
VLDGDDTTDPAMLAPASPSSGDTTATPEPGTLSLLTVAALSGGVVLWRRRGYLAGQEKRR